jgi:hypothetical protein
MCFDIFSKKKQSDSCSNKPVMLVNKELVGISKKNEKTKTKQK